MAFPVLILHGRTLTTKVPFHMDQADRNLTDNKLVIDITSGSQPCSSSSSHESLSSVLHQQDIENQPTTSSSVHIYPPQPFPVSSSRSSTVGRRRNRWARHRSPLNCILWLRVELVLTLGKIIAAVLVLSFSLHEKANAPLRTWIVGYTFGCLGILPLLYWRFKHRNLGFEEILSQTSDSTVPLTGHAVDEEDQWSTSASDLGTQSNGFPYSRLKVFFEYLKMALDCFFAIWFVVGNVWVFGGHSSSNEAPNLYRLCIVFLTFSCIGYAVPFILCATICCCMPCIISALGIREDSSQGRGATEDSINSLPTYNFTARKNTSENECGIVCAGTDKERTISEEDGVCCICLTRYVNGDELRELACSHFFHKECVDKWLRMNASCPLCKAGVGETLFDSLAEATASLRNDTIV